MHKFIPTYAMVVLGAPIEWALQTWIQFIASLHYDLTI